MSHNIHATGIVLGAVGLVIRGPSGSGKSLLALDLLDSSGEAAWLVSDDRIDIAVRGADLLMATAPNLAGLIELRGRGIVSRRYLEAAPLHLVIDLVDELVRMPEVDAFTTELLGVRLARAPVPRTGLVDARHQRLLVTEAVKAVGTPRSEA